MYTQRNQFTHEQLPMCDKDIIVQKQAKRDSNHISSALSKANSKGPRPLHVPSIGDLVYLYSKNDEWLYIKKFAGQQLRSHSYKVKTNECFCVPTYLPTLPPKHQQHFVHEDDDQEEDATTKPRMPEPNIFDNPHRDTYNPGSPPIPEVLSTPPCAIEAEQETPQNAYTEDDEENNDWRAGLKLPSKNKEAASLFKGLCCVLVTIQLC